MTTPYEPLLPGEQLFLRGCNADGTSRNGFRWPLEVGAEAVAPDWSPEPVCGQGLHGNLNGRGDASLLFEKGIGLVVAAKDAVDLDGKHKFEKCRVLFVGETLQEAATWLAGHPGPPRGAAVHYATATAGDYGTAAAGYRGTATAGDYGTATAGHQGTATAGYQGTATAGIGGVLVIRGPDGALRCAEVDEKEIKPGVAYRLNGEGEFEEAV